MNHILMILKTRNLSNDQRVLKELKSLTKSGLPPHILVCKDCETTESDLGYPLFNIDIVGGAAPKNLIVRLLGAFQFYYKVTIFINQNRYKAMWICDPILFPLVHIIKKISPDTYIIWDHHELPPSWFIKNKLFMCFFRKSYQLSDIVIHANEPRKEYLEEKLNFNKAKDCFIISNYPDTDNDSQEFLDEKAELWLEENQSNFIYLQNSLQENRYGHLIIQAALKANLKVFHAGKINYDFLDKYNLKDHNLFLSGYLSYKQINRVLDKCSFTVILYKQNSVNQIYCDANRLYQAMCFGVPIIIGNNPTLVSSTKGYENLYTLQSVSQDSLIDSFKFMIENKKKRVPKKFSWSAYTNIFNKISMKITTK